MSRGKTGCLGVLGIMIAAIGWLLWQQHVPHAIITSYWPIETYYSVHAEIELDGQMHVLEGLGRCDWRWNAFPVLAIDNPKQGVMTHHGGFLTKVLADGRAVVILPGHYCGVGAPGPDIGPGVANRNRLFPVDIDFLTGDIQSPEGRRHSTYYVRAELPRVAVLDDARAPKSIRYYPTPKVYMASGCQSLRFHSYHVTITDGGAITRRDLDVTYLANLSAPDRWVGYTARVVPFSALQKFPQLSEFLKQPPPLLTNFDKVDVGGWRWRRDIKPERLPVREIAWDRDNHSMRLPPTFVGNCPAVTTLYPVTVNLTPYPWADLTVESGGTKTFLADILTRGGLIVDGADQILFSIQIYNLAFRPQGGEPSAY